MIVGVSMESHSFVSLDLSKVFNGGRNSLPIAKQGEAVHKGRRVSDLETDRRWRNPVNSDIAI